MINPYAKSSGLFTYVVSDNGDLSLYETAVFWNGNSGYTKFLVAKFFFFFATEYYISRRFRARRKICYDVRVRNPLLGARYNIIRTYDSMKKFYLRDFRYELSAYKHDFFPANYNVFHMTFFQWYTYRYGFGKSLAYKLLSFLGINPDSSIRVRDYFCFHFPGPKVRSIFSKSVSRLDDRLALTVHKHQRANITVNCRKGIRMRAGLPSNGQRTRSNARTCKKGIYLFDCKAQNPVRRIIKRNPWITS